MEDIINATAEVPTYEWGDLYLKFTDEATAFAALYAPAVRTVVTYDAEGVATSTEEVIEGEFVTRYPHSIDTIGIIYERTGGTDEEPVMTAIPGWHVNVRGPMMPELQAYAVEVNSPVRVWA